MFLYPVGISESKNKIVAKFAENLFSLHAKNIKKLNLKRRLYNNVQLQANYNPHRKMSATNQSATTSAATAKKDFLDIANWNPQSVIMMQPKISKVGLDVNIMSSQLSGRLNLLTPYMKTWGVQDFVDPSSGVSSGKFNMVLRFPNENYGNDETSQFLEKLQKLEETILDAAYENRAVWFGDEDTTRDVIKSKYFSMLKYQKLKDANGKILKKLDFSKPPTFKIKVPYYKNKDTGIEKWNCQIYDSSKNLLFPAEDASQTPVNFVTTNSDVKCKISCASIWVGEKAWGVQWSLMLCFVKPKEVYNRFDISTIDLGGDEEDGAEEFSKPYAAAATTAVAEAKTTHALDSDDEDDDDEIITTFKPAEAKEDDDGPEEVVASVASAAATVTSPVATTADGKKKAAKKTK